MNTSQFEIIMIINATNTQIAVTFFAFFCKFTIDTGAIVTRATGPWDGLFSCPAPKLYT